MALEKLSSETLNFYAPRFEIEIKGQKLAADISKAILDVKIEEKVDQIAGFTITLNDEFDMEAQVFKWLDHPLFSEGNEVTVKMGYSNNLFTMMIGRITGIEPGFFSGETPTITLTGEDLSNEYINRGGPERTFVDMKYSDIVKTVASEAGLLAVVDTTGKYEQVIRKDNDESYLAFIKRLNNRVGYQFKVDGRTLYFIKPEDDKKEILTLELGKDIISFRPTMNTSRLVTEVEVRGNNPDDPDAPIVGRATAGSERTQEPGRRTGSQVAEKLYGSARRVISNVVVTSVEQANEMAQSELNKASDGLIEGDGECIGLTQLRKGVNIKLEKLGTRFSGKYYIKGTTHTINNNGYRTRFSVKRNAV